MKICPAALTHPVLFEGNLKLCRMSSVKCDIYSSVSECTKHQLTQLAQVPQFVAGYGEKAGTLVMSEVLP